MPEMDVGASGSGTEVFCHQFHFSSLLPTQISNSRTSLLSFSFLFLSSIHMHSLDLFTYFVPIGNPNADTGAEA